MDKSILRRLPLELREAIYTFTLHYSSGIEINLGTPNPNQQDQNPTALTQTCFQIRHECHTLFYSLNTFRLVPWAEKRQSPGQQVATAPDVRWISIGPWLRSLSPVNRAALRHVDIDIGTWSPRMPAANSPESMASRPVPGQVAAYIVHFLSTKITCTFSLSIIFSDIPHLGAFRLTNLDIRTEEIVFGSRERGSMFEKALGVQAELIAKANEKGEIDGFGVVLLMMGLDRCRRGFGEFLDAVVGRVEEEVRWGGRGPTRRS